MSIKCQFETRKEETKSLLDTKNSVVSNQVEEIHSANMDYISWRRRNNSGGNSKSHNISFSDFKL